MKRASLLLMLFLILFFVGCGHKVEKPEERVIASEENMTLTNEMYQVKQIDNEKLVFTITNVYEKDLVLNYRDAQKYDFVLLKDDERIWKWSDELMYAQVISQTVLKPGETLDYEFNFNEIPSDIFGEFEFEIYSAADEMGDISHYRGRIYLDEYIPNNDDDQINSRKVKVTALIAAAF